MHSSANRARPEGDRAEHPYIVAIGASAGGLEALQTLLSSLPPDLGFPYVVIQHLSPDYKSLLREILAKQTVMPVMQVEDGMEAMPDCVYVIPPRKNMELQNGKLFLSEQKSGELHLPIDTFFHSMAEEAGAGAIAVVLSGTGSDGTNGIKSVKEADGIILVQSPASSKFDGMPRSAIRTGLVDAQLSPELIASELAHISLAARRGIFSQKSEKELDAELMKRIYNILQQASNVNFTHYKQTTIMRRIERRMMLCHRDSLADYVDYLYNEPEEVKVLSKDVLIGVTSFFREPEYFGILQEKAIKPILLRSQENETIRVWVPGCSTGEEAYSLAILFFETMESMKIRRQVKIFATDLDAEAVAAAGKGVFGANIASAVSAARLSRFFTRKGNMFVVNRDLRRMIIFSPHNVIQDPPFGKLDLISCRNLMIYFEPVLQRDLFSIFHAALKDGGYLFLGRSEAVGAYTEMFPVVDATAKIFTHCSGGKIKGAVSVPHLQTSFAEESYGAGSAKPDRPGDYARRSTSDTQEQVFINTALLERFMPACLVINDRNELVYIYGDTRGYISYPVGRVTSALFDIIAEPLRIPVSTVLKEAREKQKMVQYRKIPFANAHVGGLISLTALPIGRTAPAMDSLYALVFAETEERGKLPDAKAYALDHMAAQRITDLEQELSRVNDHLNRSVTEQECSNEELQASNEELLTANEELQSSNEELQSVNEELYTVNAEYQVKLSELADMNDDITNFLATTLIGIIFVDSKLSVRRFTNYVSTEFGVMEQDIGRPIDIISYHFPHYDIVSACHTVLGTLVPEECEVVTSRDKTFFMRVSPFRTTENKILGCVITFMDLTAQKQGHLLLQSTAAQLSLAQEASAAKSDFLSRMSHEIRTPMGALLGLSELVQHQLDDREALSRSAKQIGETVKYMTSIVSDILEMSRIEHSQIELVNAPFSVRESVGRVLSMIAPRMEESGLTFDVSVEGLADAYVGDETRLQQILINFLTNALKFTPAGGTVCFKACEESRENGTAVLRFIVADTGVGISKAFMPDLFQPFTRERQDANAISSLGLGLAIAHNIIELMNGDVQVESEENAGSTFTFHIKMGTVATPAAKAQASKPLPVRGLHALLAEDNDINRVILESLLSQNGVSYVSARDGVEAVEAFSAAPLNSFDCILMDIRMPRMDGFEATAKIRKLDRADAKTVPIIAVSANAFAADVENASLAGIDYYITKPIDTKKLFGLLEKLRGAAKA